MKAICKGYKYTKFGIENNSNLSPFSGQTLISIEDPEDDGIWVTSSDLGDYIPIPGNLLEKMVWALLTRPFIELIILPIHVRLKTDLPEIIENPPRKAFDKIIETGFIAVFTNNLKKRIAHAESPQSFIKDALKTNVKSAFFSRPLSEPRHDIKIKEKQSQKLKRIKNIAKDRVRTSFSPEIRMYLKNLLHLIRPENPYNIYPAAEPDIAIKKKWEQWIDDIRIIARPNDIGERIPVLMVMHWLEVSGAERFAIELVRHLPKEKFAVYLITDVASENPWEHLLKGHVEEIFHLPDFLDTKLFKSFYVSFLESRKIRLVHINHAPEFYRSLAHIRRFNSKVKIMDSLYIIELPPAPGGYPDIAGRFADPFLDMHHVACIQIQDFLRQRWLVPEEKMELIYLNVDIDEFDPQKIIAGDIRKKYGIPESACLIGFIGRFVEQKRPMVFVETAAQILKKLTQGNENVCFLMAGSGYLDKKVRERIKALGLENKIILTGNISELKSFYRDVDLLVMPSANEGVALVTYESMAMETPLVFADVGAQSELLPPELLVSDSRDEKELADRFADKCLPFVINPEKRAETGKKLRKYIMENHTDKMTYASFEKLYDELCKH